MRFTEEQVEATGSKQELLAMLEASTTVKGHSRRSKSGKVATVKQHQRELTTQQHSLLSDAGDGILYMDELDYDEMRSYKNLRGMGMVAVDRSKGGLVILTKKGRAALAMRKTQDRGEKMRSIS